MPNHLRRLAVRGLRQVLPQGALRRQLQELEADPSDLSDEDLWREIARWSREHPLLAAYEDSVRGWYLAFADDGDTNCVFLQPECELNPDLPWNIPQHLGESIASDLAAAFGDDASDVRAAVSDGEDLFLNGREVRDVVRWMRVCDRLESARCAMPTVVLCDPQYEGRRFVWRGRVPTPVGHRPLPAERWQRLRSIVSEPDPEALYRSMVYSGAVGRRAGA